jgi:Superinfection immunity protein/Short C-terminal domain
MILGMVSGGLFILVVFAIALNFIPSIIALSKRRYNTGAIFVLNLFLGWSFIAWIVALVWSVSNKTNRQIIINSNIPSAEINNTNHLYQLEKLKKLYDNQVITKEEYDLQKAKLLNS